MKFHCTYCGTGIESPADSFGQFMTCPNCGAELTVPQPKATLPFKEAQPLPAGIHLSTPGANWSRKLQHFFLFGLLACFVFGAGTAIVSLFAFRLGGIQAKIFASTFSLGVYSVTGLCCALLADKRPKGGFKVFAGIGIAVSLTGALFALLTNWEFVVGLELLIKGRFSFLIVSLAFAHAALLLMINTANNVVRAFRAVTLVIIALVAIVFLSITLNPVSIGYFWVILAILCVLDVLGTIATPILHLATREPNAGLQHIV